MENGNKSYYLRPYEFLHGQYILGNVIGEGGFGITYEARDFISGKTVAIKELYISGISDRTQIQTEILEKYKLQFYQEIKLLRQLTKKKQKGIVRYLDCFEDNNTVYLVTEYLPGISLKQLLAKRKKPFSYQQCRKMFRPVLASLQELHDNGILHRDLSPDNLIYVKKDSVIIIDFGSAISRYHTEKSSIIAVKKGFAPLEQYQEDGEMGPWTDVYGICATIYRCLTGYIPKEPQKRLEKHLKRPYEYGIRMPASAQEALMKGLEVRVSDRWQSIEEFSAHFL